MKAEDVMTPNPFALAPFETVVRAAQIMAREHIGSLPIVKSYDNRELLGIITDRDIAVRCVALGHHASCAVRAHMSPAPLATVHASDDIAIVLDKMEARQVRRIPVVDDDYRLVGIIAQADIATKLGPSDAAQVEELLQKVSAADGAAV